MILLYLCAFIGALLLVLAILMLLWVSITKLKDTQCYMFLAIDDFTTLVMLMAIIGCILLGTSTMAEVKMLGGWI